MAFWSRVPDPMPSHWNAAGQVDGFSSRAVGLLIMPGMLALLAAIMAIVTAVGGRNAEAVRGASAIAATLAATGGFLLAMHAMMIHAALTPGHPLSMGWIVVGLGLMFIVIARQMPGLPRNRWCGVRTRWTMRSDSVWHLTHVYAARTMTAGGVLAVIAGLLLPPMAGFIAGMLAIVAGSLAPVVYSYFAWRAETESGVR
jgi:uncharacterized membrane protein